jgi:hypothetical protein
MDVAGSTPKVHCCLLLQAEQKIFLLFVILSALSLFEIRQSSRKTEKGCHFLSFLHLFLYFSCCGVQPSHPPKLGDREEVA